MESELINRIGIIINFISGFMIAPELIGIKRLRKFELTLKKFLSNAILNFKNQLLYLAPIDVINSLVFFFILIGALFSFIILLTVVVSSLFYDQSIISVYKSIYNSHYILWFVLFIWPLTSLGFSFSVLSNESIKRKFMLGLAILFLPLIMCFVIAYLFAISFIIKIMGNLINLLEGEKSMRRLVVSAGIFLLILGTSLQFLSTF